MYILAAFVASFLTAKQFLRGQSFVAISVKGDGNCLYRTVSMCLFGNEDYHVQLRLGAIYFVLKYESYFEKLLSVFESKDFYNRPITDHIERFGEVIGDSRFRIATPYESHNSTYPLTFLLYKEHFVSLVAIKGDENVFDYSSTQFFNNFNNLKINLMLNDCDFI